MVGGEQQGAWRWPAMAAALVAGLNVFDALFTVALLQLGIGREANPLMRGLYQLSPWLFVAVKAAAVTGALAILLRHRARRLARLALALAAVVYLALVAYELAGLAGAR